MANDIVPYGSLGEDPVVGLEGLLFPAVKGLDPTLALKDTARRVLADYIPQWRKRDFQNGVYDFQIQAVLPSVTDNSYRSKENPCEALLVSAAYEVLVEQGFEAVNGQWYVPDPARR